MLHTDGEFISVLQVKFHGDHSGSVPDDVPDLTISGVNITEKLQEIYFKTVHLYLHISQVEEQQKKNWGNPQSVVEPLTQVKRRLRYLSAKLKQTLLDFDSKIPLSTPAPPQLSHTDDYAQKEYGWGVIVTLKGWPHQVLQVLKAEEVCDNSRGTLGKWLSWCQQVFSSPLVNSAMLNIL